jgi:Sec-independent protein secretion pathway component TatC
MKGKLALFSRVLVAATLTFVTHFAIFMLCWGFREPLLLMIGEAIRTAGVDPLGPAAAPSFGTFLNVAFFASLLVASPFVVALWLFILTGPDTWQHRILYLLTSLGLAGVGTTLGYVLLFPAVARLTEWGAGHGVLPAESTTELLLRVVVGSALAFEIIPTVLALRGWRLTGDALDR